MRRRRTSTPTPVGALLTAALPPLADALVARAVRRDWTGLVGPQISGHAQPGDLRAGTLSVVVANSPWLQELTLREGELLSRLQARYGAESIRALRFTLGTPAPAPEVRDRERAGGDGTLTSEQETWVAGTAASVGDPILAETVRRLLAKDTLSRRRGGARS